MDHGHDFYARRVSSRPMVAALSSVGWIWESPLPEQQDGWAGMLSLPRELSLSADNRLQMRPAKEVESMRGASFPWPVTTLKNQQTTMVENCEAMEVILHWDGLNSSASSRASAAKVCAFTWMRRCSAWCLSDTIPSMASAAPAPSR